MNNPNDEPIEEIKGRFFRIDSTAPRICDSERSFDVTNGPKPGNWVYMMAVASSWDDAGMIVKALNNQSALESKIARAIEVLKEGSRTGVVSCKNILEILEAKDADCHKI